MDHRAAIVIASAAAAIQTAARSHKRAEFAHRKQARELMQQLETLRRACDQLGITLEITDTPERR